MLTWRATGHATFRDDRPVATHELEVQAAAAEGVARFDLVARLRELTPGAFRRWLTDVHPEF